MQTSKSSILKFGNQHLRYEIKCVCELYEVLFRDTKVKASISTKYQKFLYESLCVHLRCLFEFFSSKDKRSNDVRYDDFGIKSNNQFKWPLSIKNTIKKVNSRIAHLSMARMNTSSNYQLKRFSKAISVNLQIFLALADPELIGRPLAREIKNLSKII